MLWPFYCLISVAVCTNYLHRASDIPSCDKVQIGEVCSPQNGKPLKIKTKED